MKAVHAVKFVVFAGQYSFSVQFPEMPDEVCKEVMVCLDDLGDFVEDCLQPIVEFKGSGERKRLGFTCEVDSIRCDFD